MDIVIQFLKTPPGYLVTVLVAIIVGHLIKVGLRMPPGRLIPTLEFLLIVTLIGILGHFCLMPAIAERNDLGLVLRFVVTMTSILLVFTVISMFVYLASKRWFQE